MNLLKQLMLSALIVLPTLASAQIRTDYVNLVREDHAPLYDCNIFSSSANRNDCFSLTRRERFPFDYGGYAVNCYRFRGYDQNRCLDLARDASRYSDSISCHRINRSYDRDLCETTKRGYARGEFSDRNYRPGPSHGTSTTTTTTVVRQEPVTRQVVVNNSCATDAYDRAYNDWRARREELKRRGRDRTTVGAIVTIGGLILGTSNNDVVNGVGQVMTIGGATLMTLGLVDLNRASFSMPHMMPYCQSAFVTEVRRVEIERRQCTTTRYTEHGRHTSRSYYEVVCQSERYVTFEEMPAWRRGTVVRY